MSTFVTPTIVAKEALLVLENNLVMANLVHRDFSKEYQKIGSTVVIRKPTSFTASAVSGGTARHMNTITESSVVVVLDTHLDVSFEVNSQEMALQVKDFSEQFIQPAILAIADTVDTKIMDHYKDVAGHYAVSATPLVSDIAELGAVMTTQQVPLGGRRLVLHPITGAGYMSVATFHEAQKRGDGGRALRDAEIGHVLGFQTYMDQNVMRHTQPMADAAGALQEGFPADATIATVSGVTASSTALVDDVVKFTAYDAWFSVSKLATADSGGSALILNFDQANKLGVTIPAVTIATIQKTHRANLAFHRDFVAMVTAPLPPPLSGNNAAVLTSPSGLSMRVVFDWDGAIKTNVVSIDMLMGTKLLEQKLAARLADTR